jgi:hypothetical protein
VLLSRWDRKEEGEGPRRHVGLEEGTIPGVSGGRGVTEMRVGVS